IYQMALRNIGRNKKRTILSAVAIGMSVLFICFMKSYIGGFFGNAKENVFAFQSAHVKVVNKDFLKEEKLMPLDLSVYGYDKDYKEVINLVKKVKGVKHVFPRTKFGAIVNLKGKWKNLLGFALDPELEAPINPLKEKIIEGRMFQEFAPGRYEIVMGEVLAKELGVKVGDKVTMMTKTAEEGLGHMTFQIVGISSYGVPEFDKMFFFIPLSVAAKFLKMENEVMELGIYLEDFNESIPVAEKINTILESKPDNPYVALAWESQSGGQFYKAFAMAENIYNVVYLVFMVLASLVIINTTMMVIYERMKEIGTIAALGMRGTEIVKLFFYEAVIISIIGSFAGVIGGGTLSFIFFKTGINVAKLTGGAMNDMSISNIVYTYFGVDLLVFAFVYGVVVASLCALIPASKAARIQPVEAMKGVM
ncbi:MAG: FtsX-like permease family protein, partial [Spirochaetes bacterium]|nr:FtsX-like permease family protein [Spirochaetota bacterium]